MNKTKVFGIGFQKTGTSSLGKALTILGYNVKGHFGRKDTHIANHVYDIAFQLVEKYDAFEDHPWPVLYRELDRKYQGSKFILTVRPTDEWIESVVTRFGLRSRPLEKFVYGVGRSMGNEQIFISRYESHNDEVMEYFRDRPDDLLVLKITEGDGWEKLCQFLDKDIPNVPFPHINIIEEKKLNKKIQYSFNKLIRRFYN